MRKWIWAGLGLIAALLVAGVVFGREPVAYAHVATGFAAKQTCSCLKLSKRDLASCKTDFPADAVKLLRWDVADDRVKVSAFGVISAEAVYEDGFGCHLVR